MFSDMGDSFNDFCINRRVRGILILILFVKNKTTAIEQGERGKL